jgi:hypothetical protein
MQKLRKLRSLSLAACACAALAITSPTFAHGGGWHGGGWHGGYHGGYGYGWRGGWGWGGGYWGPWGWGWGPALGVGLYFATLPYYYSTYWWGGVPYYYAGNNYFVWNGEVGQYQTVAPPAEVLNHVQGEDAAPSNIVVYPKNGQSEEQLGKDRFECHRWAVTQSGFDPTQAAGGSAPGNRTDYVRAQSACLEGRGYSVK